MEIMDNTAPIAYCGLYCGECKRYKNGKCPGCLENAKASWCKIRTCNQELAYSTCAECPQIKRVNCKKLNNPFAKFFELIFRTDRLASLKYIRENGGEAYSEKMCSLGQMSFKKGQKI